MRKNRGKTKLIATILIWNTFSDNVKLENILIVSKSWKTIFFGIIFSLWNEHVHIYNIYIEASCAISINSQCGEISSSINSTTIELFHHHVKYGVSVFIRWATVVRHELLQVTLDKSLRLNGRLIANTQAAQILYFYRP